jgi:tetratricopeptide (TPR) repeat protein
LWPVPWAVARSSKARAALEYGRTLFYANRLVDAITVLSEASDALGDDDPDLKEHFDAEIIASARWVADYYPLAAERLAAIDETELHGGAGSAQLLASLAVDEAVRCGSRERATRRARQALAMGVLQDEEAIGYYHAVNALFMAGEAEEACAAYEQAVRRAMLRGDPFALSNLLGLLAYVRLRLGRLLDAEADLREGLELSRAAAAPGEVARRALPAPPGTRRRSHHTHRGGTRLRPRLGRAGRDRRLTANPRLDHRRRRRPRHA